MFSRKMQPSWLVNRLVFFPLSSSVHQNWPTVGSVLEVWCQGKPSSKTGAVSSSSPMSSWSTEGSTGVTLSGSMANQIGAWCSCRWNVSADGRKINIHWCCCLCSFGKSQKSATFSRSVFGLGIWYSLPFPWKFPFAVVNALFLECVYSIATSRHCSTPGHVVTSLLLCLCLLQLHPSSPFHSKTSMWMLTSTLTWRCISDGIPTPSYQWYRNATRLDISQLPDKDRDRYSINTNVLTIRNVNKDDAAMYQCRATNTHGSEYSSCPAQDFVYVLNISWAKAHQVWTALPVVLFVCFLGTLGDIMHASFAALAPTFEKFPLQPMQYATLNNNLTIICSPEAAPYPQISWQKDGRDLNPSGNIIQLPNGNLHIDKVKESDAGRYTCIATNELGTAESSIELDILSKIDVHSRCNTVFILLIPQGYYWRDTLACRGVGY